jgi:adenylate cyclase
MCAEAARLAEEHGFPYVLGMATVNRGWALMMQHRTEVGIPMLRDGVAKVERTGAGLARPLYLFMLAAAHAMEGDRKSALARIDEAFREFERTGERLHEAPLLVAKGRLLADGTGRSSRAAGSAIEDCLRRAIDVARAQGARLFHLRAAVALARHCRERGRADDAVEALGAAYAWFEERPEAAIEVAEAGRLLAALQA